MIEKCELCETEKSLSSVFTTYSEFRLGMYGNKICIQDTHGHDDSLKVNYCPLCGKELS